MRQLVAWQGAMCARGVRMRVGRREGGWVASLAGRVRLV